MKKLFLIFIVLGLQWSLSAQEDGKIRINGKVLPFMIDECGDTLVLADLKDVNVSSLRQFNSEEEYRLYQKYKRYAAKVYPYAVKAIKIFKEVDYATQNMKKKQRRKYNKRLYKQLKEEFGDPLKKLTKTQGKILIAMIERELDEPMYDLIKDLRGGFTATYWSFLSSFYGYKLKRQYDPAEDPILEAVLVDLDVSHSLTVNKEVEQKDKLSPKNGSDQRPLKKDDTNEKY